MADSGLYPPGGCALRRRSLKVLTSADDRVTSRFPARWGPELGGTGGWVGGGMATVGSLAPCEMIASELDDNRDRSHSPFVGSSSCARDRRKEAEPAAPHPTPLQNYYEGRVEYKQERIERLTKRRVFRLDHGRCHGPRFLHLVPRWYVRLHRCRGI